MILLITILNISKTLIYIAEESILKTSSNKNIISHGSMVIVKLQSDHARQLYENSIYSLVLKLSITLKFIGQKLIDLLNHPRKHLGEITSIKSSSRSKKVWDMIRKFSVKIHQVPSKTYPKTISRQQI